MAARAIWKGVIRLGGLSVPVKLYSAVEDRTVRFRLLHEDDGVPVKQELVNPQTDEVVPYDQARRGFVTDDGELVIIEPDELERLEPESSRDIDVIAFLPPDAIDHRWYLRPYYLGPDGKEQAYTALTKALERSGREGLARWTMRDKEYVGALRLFDGYPMLITLRNAEQVVPADQLEAPGGRELDERELAMAAQLMEMLAGPFDPNEFRDEFRERVLEMIEVKAKGGTVKRGSKPKRERFDDLTEALRASLESIRA